MSNLPAGLRQAYEMVKFVLFFRMSYFGMIIEWHELYMRYPILGFGEFCTDGAVPINICKAYNL